MPIQPLPVESATCWPPQRESEFRCASRRRCCLRHTEVPQLTRRSITSFAEVCARSRWAMRWHDWPAVYAPGTGLTLVTRSTPSSSQPPSASEVALWQLPTLTTCGLSPGTTPAFESNQSTDRCPQTPALWQRSGQRRSGVLAFWRSGVLAFWRSGVLANGRDRGRVDADRRIGRGSRSPTGAAM